MLATAVAVGVSLVLAAWALAGMFRDHVARQFATALAVQLDQVTARFDVDADGRPAVDAAGLSDPRWTRPYSGLYWQVDRVDTEGRQRAVLRSRSLWDAELEAPRDGLADGEVHLHEVSGPAQSGLLLLERTIRVRDAAGDPAAPGASWRLLVAADRQSMDDAVAGFRRVLGGSLGVLLLLLLAAAVAQVAIGLAPLRALRRALADVHARRTNRLEGRFPAEVAPLIDDFNRVLEQQARTVERARTQAGNLAHAIKTPLAVMAQAAHDARHGPASARADLAGIVDEQVAAARRHVDWHLARARAAAAQATPGLRAELRPVVDGLARAMRRLHAARGLDLDMSGVPEGLAFAGEAQDLQEMLGNLLDNACQWANHAVRVTARATAGGDCPRLSLRIDDDGPGIAAERRAVALARGGRLDESTPGSGLGLAIVSELAESYGGSLTLGESPSGGLGAQLTLPCASP